MGASWAMAAVVSSPEPTKGVSSSLTSSRDTTSSQTGRLSFLRVQTTPGPEKHVRVQAAVCRRRRRGPIGLNAATRPFCETPGGKGHLGLVAGRGYGLDVPRRSTVTGWHLEQSVRPTGVTDDRCSSHLSGGKLSGVTLDTAPAHVRRHVGWVAFEAPMFRGRPFFGEHPCSGVRSRTAWRVACRGHASLLACCSLFRSGASPKG
mmetsp:Transcript_102206/g.176492  ORF Transcript_102206/g.176492 Transcript_102206/m.176492 type:complete len:205 (-) Transcript_102206:124-738(-)